MKQMLLKFAAYRCWANKILIKKLKEVPEETLLKDMSGSFGNIYNTMIHVANADYIWWQRMHLKEKIEPLPADVTKDFEKLSDQIIRMSDQWVEWIRNNSELKLQHVLEYRNSKREAFKQPVNELLMHVFNHQTYHYGQVVCMLRQQNTGKIPATDFIAFLRKVKKV